MCSNTANKSLISNLAQTTMTLSDFLDDILFVIVLYKQTPEKSCAYNALQDLSRTNNHSLSLFIYDNSPEASAIHSSTVMYRHDAQNSGVSKAYNEAAVYADKLKKKWLLLLDQDTKLHEHFVKMLLEAVRKNSKSVAFVPILADVYSSVSPFRWSLGRGIRMEVFEKKLTLKKFRFLNSGLLIERESFQKAGGYPEFIPLYFSDIAFGEKLKKVIDHFIVIPTVLKHSFSASEKINLDAALHRYYYFCVGAFAMGKTFGPYVLYYLRAFLRGLNLSLQYRTIIFLTTFYTASK